VPNIRKSLNPIFAVPGIVGVSLAAGLNLNTPARWLSLCLAVICVVLIAAFWLGRRYASTHRRE